MRCDSSVKRVFWEKFVSLTNHSILSAILSFCVFIRNGSFPISFSHDWFLHYLFPFWMSFKFVWGWLFYLLLRFNRLVIFPLIWFLVGKYNTTFFIKSGSRLFTMIFRNLDIKFKHVIVGRGKNLAKNRWHWSELKAKKKSSWLGNFLYLQGKRRAVGP